MSTLVPPTAIKDMNEVAPAIADVVNREIVYQLLCFFLRDRTSVLLFSLGIFCLVLFYVLRLTQKL
jgi:hypothetical protein